MGALQTNIYISLVILVFIPKSFSQTPPGSPEITAPQTIIFGQTYTLRCTVTGGNPAPTVKWLRDNQVIDDTQTSSGNTYINEYEFTASADEHLEVFECQSENGVLQNPLSKTTFVEVYRPPNIPVLSGPQSVLSGTSTVWTCTSSGAYPAQTMKMRIEGTEFNSQFTPNTVFNPTDKSYTVTGTLTWAPTMANNGQTLYCDVYHPETRGANNPQTVNLPLTVQSPLAVQAPNLNYAATAGQPLTIVCQVIAGTATAITWQKNNQQIVLSSDTRLSGSTPNTPSLTISQVQTNDAGSYQCRATDGTTTVQTNIITVTVYVPLAVTAPRTSYTPTLRQQVVLACQVTAGTATSITWYKNSQQITLANDARLSGSSPGNPSLTINQVRTGDAGTYTCQGTDGTTTVQTNPITVSVYTPLAVNAPQTSYTPTVGQGVTLQCVVTAGTATSITWYKNGQQITLANNARLSGSTPSNPSLAISQVQTGDAGTYRCQGSDGTTTVQTNQITVTVYTPLAVNAPQTSYTPTVGQGVTLQCVVTAGTATSITWYKNGQQITLANNARLSGSTPSNPSLAISQVQTGDAGTYRCQGSDGTTTVQTNQITVTVYTPLTVNAPQTSYTPTVGQQVILQCVVTSGTATSITWFKNSQQITLSGNARLSGSTPSNPSLTISQVQAGDAGTYRCQGTDGTTTVQTNPITVTVYTPLAVNAPQTSYTPTVGQGVTLQCVVTAGTATSITWYKNGQQITLANNARLSGSTPSNPSLTISQVQAGDSGTYRCQGSDGTTTVQTNQITVTVYTPLAVTAPQTSYNPTLAQTVNIVCQVTAGTPTSITWFKNSQQLSLSNNARLSGSTTGNPSLTISQVQTSDAGTYQCQGSDGTTTVRTDPITVTVYIPLQITADQYQYTPTEEDTLVINCRVTSGTPTAINWYKNSQLIVKANDARLSGGTTTNPSLTITTVQMTDAGSYECEASDGTQTVRTNVISVTVNQRVITEEIIITDILTGYNKLVRPTPSPNIEHSLHPTRIIECDGKNLVIQGYVCMYWNDPRLSWTRGQDSVSLPSSYIWLPDVTQEGEKPDFYKAPIWAADKVVVTKDGRVSFCPQGIFTAMNCAEKDGEKHQCSMKFRSWSYDKELMDINLPTTGREAVDLSGLETHSECEIVNKCAVRNERTYACCGNRLYPDVTYTLVWQRRRNYCVNLSEQPTCNA